MYPQQQTRVVQASRRILQLYLRLASTRLLENKRLKIVLVRAVFRVEKERGKKKVKV